MDYKYSKELQGDQRTWHRPWKLQFPNVPSQSDCTRFIFGLYSWIEVHSLLYLFKVLPNICLHHTPPNGSHESQRLASFRNNGIFPQDKCEFPLHPPRKICLSDLIYSNNSQLFHQVDFGDVILSQYLKRGRRGKGKAIIRGKIIVEKKFCQASGQSGKIR